MEFEENKKTRVERLHKSVELFSNSNKKRRELWVVAEFLSTANVTYTEEELQHLHDDPPDVSFRDCRFEVMEILDDGRKRHDECKKELCRAIAANNESELYLTETWEQESLSLSEVLSDAAKKLQVIKGDKYRDTVKADLDVLIYVNKKKITIDDEDFELTEPISSSLSNWRSVSLVFNQRNNKGRVCVAHAQESAPSFIQAIVGRAIYE